VSTASFTAASTGSRDNRQPLRVWRLERDCERPAGEELFTDEAHPQKVELFPQFWLLRAGSLTNLGGNPALSLLGSDDLGQELNLTLKYFPNRKVYIQGHVAWTLPGEAVDEALGNEAENWFSTMLFTRIAF